MTAGPQEITQAQQAQAAGESAAAQHASDTQQMQATIAGSQVWVEAPATIDDTAAGNIGTGSPPPYVSPQPSSSPNVTDPLDNSQSQG